MRITKKTKLFRGYTRDFAISNVIDEMTYKLGQLEDILEKYGIDDVKELDKILEIHMFLLNHNYQTLPKEDLDALFNELERIKFHD